MERNPLFSFPWWELLIGGEPSPSLPPGQCCVSVPSPGCQTSAKHSYFRLQKKKGKIVKNPRTLVKNPGKLVKNPKKLWRIDENRRILTPIIKHGNHILLILWRIHKTISSFLENFIFALPILLSEFFGQIGGTLKFTFSSFLESTFW